MKSFTDLSQSKVLAKILPIESADNHYWYNGYDNYICGLGNSVELKEKFKEKGLKYLPCWSLAALLDVLPYKERIALAINDYQGVKEAKYAIGSVENDTYDCYADNPIDACYEMIIKLHEQKLL